MLHRNLAIALHRVTQTPGPVLVEGPRSAGKTTLLRHEYPRRLYLTLEDPADRRAARQDPAAFLLRLRSPAIIDDVQRAPELVAHLAQAPESRSLILASPLKLCLPVKTLRLYHPTRAELERRPPLPIEMLGNFVPRITGAIQAFNAWPTDRRLIERDVQELVRVQDLDRFDSFARLAFESSGQVLDQQKLADLAGASRTTAVRWLAVLDACFLTCRVPACDYDFGRRLVRSPKLHFFESALFESRVVSEIYRNAAHTGEVPDLHYWRDSNGTEVALVLELPLRPPMAVGVAESPTPADEARLERWMALAGTRNAAIVSNRIREQRRGPILRYSLDQL
jgi:hypothetical protein